MGRPDIQCNSNLEIPVLLDHSLDEHNRIQTYNRQAKAFSVATKLPCPPPNKIMNSPSNVYSEEKAFSDFQSNCMINLNQNRRGK